MTDAATETFVIPEQHELRDFLEAMVADGWVASNRSRDPENDFTVELQYDYPELSGHFMVVFRCVKNSFQGKQTIDTRASGWFVQEKQISERLKSRSERGFAVPEAVVYPYPYSIDSFVKAIGYCDWDKKWVGFENLHRVAFAQAVCQDHLNAARKKWESKGWAD